MVRVETRAEAGVAFDSGIYDETTGKSLFSRTRRIEGGAGDAPVGDDYRLYDFGAYDFGDNSVVVWVGTTGGVDPKNIKAIYVDRFILVRE